MTIGFKEWSRVCELLEGGIQTLILRKGGIAEGRDGFQFRHPAFFLFPTHFHEQEQALRPQFLDRLPGRDAPDKPPAVGTGRIVVRLFAEIVASRVLVDWDAVAGLVPYHGWKEATVRERFDYKDTAALSVAVLRVHRLPEPWRFPDSPRFGGCRSWLDLPECPQRLFAGKAPVLPEEAIQSVVAALPG